MAQEGVEASFWRAIRRHPWRHLFCGRSTRCLFRHGACREACGIGRWGAWGLVTATPLTLHEKKMRDLLAKWDSAHFAILLPLPGLVEFTPKEAFLQVQRQRGI